MCEQRVILLGIGVVRERSCGGGGGGGGGRQAKLGRKKRTIEKAAAEAAAIAKKKLTTGNEGRVLACLLACRKLLPARLLDSIVLALAAADALFRSLKGQPWNPLQYSKD